MNAYYKKQKQKKRKSIFRKWHRRIGFSAALFVLIIAITGILLNHYEALGLHKGYLKSSLLLDLYGIKSPNKADCITSKHSQTCQLGESLYVDGQFWQKDNSPLLAYLENADDRYTRIIITAGSVYWLNRDLQLIDKLSLIETLDDFAQSAWFDNAEIQVKTNNGIYQLDNNLLEWRLLTTSKLIAGDPGVELTGESIAAMQEDYRGRQITLLNLVQDIHSGRIIGLGGKLVNDITAIILILLVISGFITWQRRKGRPD